MKKPIQMENKIKPISPKEVIELKKIDDRIIEIVNEILSEEYISGSEVRITLKRIKQVLQSEKYGVTSTELEEMHRTKQFDFEFLYRKQGWEVSFDKPGYNETYDSFYEFSVK